MAEAKSTPAYSTDLHFLGTVIGSMLKLIKLLHLLDLN